MKPHRTLRERWLLLLCRMLGHRPSHTTPPAAPMDFCARCGFGYERGAA